MAFKQDEMVMDAIWHSTPKAPDENHITLAETDLQELWNCGFVDTDRFSVTEWKKAFEPHKTPEGNFVLTKEDLLEKDKYRYGGEVMIPFEPLIINEGKYTNEGLNELIDLSIVPSCSLSKKEVYDFFDIFKDKYREKNDLIRVDMKGKREIADLLTDHPSPRRIRELLYEMMFLNMISEIEKGETGAIMKATPEQAAEIQISTFTNLPSQAAMAHKELLSVEKRKERATHIAPDEGVALKKVKKSRKGFRG